MHRYSAKVFIRKDGVKKDGKAPLYLQVFINGQRLKIHLRLFVDPKHFVDKSEKIKVKSDPDFASKINAILMKKKVKANNIFINAIDKNETLNKQLFLEYYGSESSGASFLNFVKSEIDNEKEVRARNTIKGYNTFHSKLSEFSEEVDFSDIDFDFLQKFNKWLIVQGYKGNYIGSIHKNFKKFINLAIKKGKRISNPFKDFKIRRTKSDRAFLTIEEQKILIDIYNSNNLSLRLHRVLRYFLFMCFTGIRVSDLRVLKHSNVIENNLVFHPQKTKNINKLLSIPLSEFAQKLIYDSSGVGEYLFNCISDQKINDFIKEIAAEAKIKKKLTNHVGRHTFAITFLILGGKVEVLKELLGHEDIKTTMIYVHITNSQKKNQMENFNKFFPFN